MALPPTGGPTALASLYTAMIDIDAPGGDAEYVAILLLRASAAVETYCNRHFAEDYVLPDKDGRTLPYDVEAVVIDLAKRAYHARGRDMSIRSSDVDGLASVSYFDLGNMPDVLAALAPYRVRIAL